MPRVQAATRKSAAATPASGTDTRWRFPARWVCFCLALAVLSVASLAAFRQPPRPDPYAAPTLFSGEWWRQPIELNAVRRLTLIRADIRDIALVPKTNTFWIAGTGGLLASSTDGGRTWLKREIAAAAAPASMREEKAKEPTGKVPAFTPPPVGQKGASLEDRSDLRRVSFGAGEAPKRPISKEPPNKSTVDPSELLKLDQSPIYSPPPAN